MSGRETARLVEALCEAFSHEELEMVLLLRLEKRLADITPSGPHKVAVFHLVGVAVREGWERDLIRAACEDMPVRPALLRFCQEHPHFAPDGIEEGDDAVLVDIRSRLLLASDREILRLKFEVERYLSRNPDSIDGRLLLDQIESALPTVPLRLPSRPSPGTRWKAGSPGGAWSLASLLLLGGLVVFGCLALFLLTAALFGLVLW